MKIGEQIVIFDTNSIRNAESITTFLGGRSDLERFASICEIVLPDMVLEEIKKQRKQHLLKKKNEFLSNPLHQLLKLDQKNTQALNIDEVISDLESSETFSYRVIYLTKPEALNRIKKMCIECSSPFSESEDKGFKDAYILLTIEEFLETVNEDQQVFFVTNDKKLTEASRKLPKLKIISNFSDFEKLNLMYFHDPYFLSVIKEHLGFSITTDSIIDVDVNINSNWLLKIDAFENFRYIEIDFSTKEIISDADENFAEDIDKLKITRNFQNTHDLVAKLNEYVPFFSRNQIVNLVRAAITNEQIYWIAKDEDIKEFFAPLFIYVEDELSQEERISYKAKFI